MAAIEILDKLPNSDHLPLQAAMDIDFNCVFNCIDVSACPKDKISYNWSQCTPDDLEKYIITVINMQRIIFIALLLQSNILENNR